MGLAVRNICRNTCKKQDKILVHDNNIYMQFKDEGIENNMEMKILIMVHASACIKFHSFFTFTKTPRPGAR